MEEPKKDSVTEDDTIEEVDRSAFQRGATNQRKYLVAGKYDNFDAMSNSSHGSNDSENFEDIMKFYQNELKPKSNNSGNRLPQFVSQLVGEANKLYLEKDFDGAIKICCEAIKIFPENPEPYHLISVIYEELGQHERSANFLFMETQLNYKSDIQNWWRLADKFYDLEIYRNAGYCYGRALKCDKSNISLLFKKAQCYDKLKDIRGAIKYYRKIYYQINTQKEVVIKLAKLYSKINHKLKAIALCLDYLNRNQETIDYDVANITVDLLISKSCFVESCYFVEALIEQERQFGGIETEELIELGLVDIQNPDQSFVGENKSLQKLQECIHEMIRSNYDPQGAQDNSLERKATTNKFYVNPLNQILYPEVNNLEEQGNIICPTISMLTLIQNHIPIDILMRYIESLMRVDAPKEQLLYLLNYLEELDCHEYYDILLDVIEVYSELVEYDLALSICEKVMQSENIEDKSIILLKIGILYGKQNLKDQEAQAYMKALEINPQDNKVRFRLSELYESVGKIREALEILETDDFRQNLKDGDPVQSSKPHSNDKDGCNPAENYEQTRSEKDDQPSSSEEEKLPDELNMPSRNTFVLNNHVSANIGSIRANTKSGLLPMLHSLNTSEAQEYSSRIQNLICEKIKENNGLNPRTQRRMQNLVENNILYFSNLSRTIKNHLQKCNFDGLLLEFRRCEIKLKNQNDDFYFNSFGCILESLKLELKKRKLFSQIYLNLLRENKGKLQIASKSKFSSKNPDQSNDKEFMEEDEENDEEGYIGVKREAPDSATTLRITSSYLKDNSLFSKEEQGYEDKEPASGRNTITLRDSSAHDESLGLFIFKRKKDLTSKVGYNQKLQTEIAKNESEIYDHDLGHEENLNQTNREFNLIFNNSKNKSRIANHLSSILIKDLTTIADAISEEKYITILGQFMQLAFEHKDFSTLAEVCEHLLKLNNRFSSDIGFQNDFYHFGFISNYRLANFEKCFIYFRKIAKVLLELAQLKSEAEESGQIFIPQSKKIEFMMERYVEFSSTQLATLVYAMIFMVFNQFKNHSQSVRGFFQKFKEQFHTEKYSKMSTHISGLLYTFSGSLDQLQKSIDDNLRIDSVGNRLYDLLLGFSSLMDSTNRNNRDKTRSINSAFEYLSRHEMRSNKNLQQKSEAWYNIGRAFTHVNCPLLSLRMFQKVRRAEESKYIEEKIAKMVTGNPEDVKDFEDSFDYSEAYKRSIYNEYVWHAKNHNPKMQKLMVDQYLTIEEF